MPGEVSTEKESPYLEKLKRPESARKAPVTSPRSDTQPKTVRSKSAKTRKSSPGKRHKKKKKDEMEKEIACVSKEVKQKLELYMNEEKRQNRFNVCGHSTTTNRMAEFDIAYKVLEYDQLERKSPRNPKTRQSKGVHHGKSADPYNIQPKLDETSRRVTGYSEADRLSKYASEIFSSYPVEKLAQIHRYRPHPKDNAKSPELGNILGYTGHVGAALHQKNYVDFFIKEGLDSGDPKKSTRLQKLPKKKDSHNNSRRSSDASSKKSGRHDSKGDEKKSKKFNTTRKSKPSKTRKVSESTEESVEQSIQDDGTTGNSSTKEEDNHEDTDNTSSTENTTCDGHQRPKHKRNHANTKELNQKSKESLDKTWAYYESGEAKEGESTRDHDSDVTDDKTNTADHMTEDGYTYSDGENNNNNPEEIKKDENINAESDTENEYTSDEEDRSQKGDVSGKHKNGNEPMMRSYTSVEHMREVDIADI